MRSWAQATAKPVFRMPPGYSVVWVESMTESGEIAARLGGLSLGGEQLADPAVGDAHHPDLVVETHGWRAMVSTTS